MPSSGFANIFFSAKMWKSRILIKRCYLIIGNVYQILFVFTENHSSCIFKHGNIYKIFMSILSFLNLLMNFRYLADVNFCFYRKFLKFSNAFSIINIVSLGIYTIFMFFYFDELLISCPDAKTCCFIESTTL